MPIIYYALLSCAALAVVHIPLCNEVLNEEWRVVDNHGALIILCFVVASRAERVHDALALDAWAIVLHPF